VEDGHEAAGAGPFRVKQVVVGLRELFFFGQFRGRP
jgi:hypothetical protein